MSGITAVCLFLFSLVSAAGTYEYRLRNAMSGLSFPSLQSEPAAQLTTQPDWHVSVFQRPSALSASDYVSIPIMAAPVCLAYNLSKPATFEVTLAGLGALLLGTANPSAVSLTTAGSLTAVLASQVVFVLAPPSTSPSSALLLANLVSNGVTGFTSKAAWPAALSTNPLVAMVADEAALAATLASTSGAMGPLPLAAGSGLPCSRVRVVTSTLTLETASYTPYLPSSTTMNHLTVSSSEPVSVTSTGAAYPLVGALVLSVRVQAACSASAEAQAFGVRVFTDTGFIASLLPWGFAPLLNDDALVATRTMILGTCGNYTRVVAGGSSAITTAVAGWVLKYLSETLYFVDYRPDGSGTGLVGAETGTHAIAASDSLFTAAQFAQYPNIRFAPALAWAVSLVFNLDGFSTVSLPRCALLPIFNGTIKYWDDPLIQRANPAAVLPHTPISVVARTGTSGTTEVFTGGLAQLDAACNGGLNASVARSNAWKLPYQLAAGSTGGIVSAVQKTVGAIGYVAAPSARSQLMAEATIVDEKTNAGTTTSNNFVSAALATSVLDPVTNELTFKVSGTAYPFVGVTYYVIDANRSGNCSAATIGLQFANWTINQQVAHDLAETATFVTLENSQSDIVATVMRVALCNGELLFPQPSYSSSTTSSLQVTLAVSGVAVGILIFAAAVAAGRVAFSSARDLTRAPKDSDKPFTIVFTDIDSSTSQWALSPVEMGPALDQHHDIMRLLIKKHKGYEVKTIGDCFMVAFKEAADAVSFGLDVQNAFYDAEWNPIFDANYRELKSAAIDAAMNKKGLSNELPLRAQLRNENYHRLWKGLRVRVGVHFGRGDAKFDEVTQAYDYYGTVVNTAARVESVAHGGQICVTDDAWNACLLQCDSSVRQETNVTDLGDVELRGLTEPVRLLQLLPARFKDRIFPPLRLDHDISVDLSDPTGTAEGNGDATGEDLSTVPTTETGTISTYTDDSSCDPTLGLARHLCRGHPEHTVSLLSLCYHFTNALYSTMRPEERRKTLNAIRRAWRLSDETGPSMRPFKEQLGHEALSTMLLAHRAFGTLNPKDLTVSRRLAKSNGTNSEARAAAPYIVRDEPQRNSGSSNSSQESVPLSATNHPSFVGDVPGSD